MPETSVPSEVRLEFTEHVVDPADPDIMRRSINLFADRLTFAGDHLVLWHTGTEVARFPSIVVEAIIPQVQPTKGSGFDLAQMRALYVNYGQPWSREDDDELSHMYRAGQRDITAIAAHFGRRPSAIRARIDKLALDKTAED